MSDTISCDGFYGSLKATLTINKNNKLFIKNYAGNHIYESYKISNPLANFKFTGDGLLINNRKVFTCETESVVRFKQVVDRYNQLTNSHDGVIMIDGNKYIGNTIDNEPNGPGIMYYENTDNVMIKSNFKAGLPDGHTIIYSEDQTVEITCDDICDMIPRQYGKLNLLNSNKSFNVSFKNNQYDLKLGVRKFIDTLFRDVLTSHKCDNIDYELFINKNSADQNKILYKRYQEISNQTEENKQNIIEYKYNVRRNNMLSLMQCIFMAIFFITLYSTANM